MLSDKEILDSINDLREQVMELDKQPKDTSNDGISVLETPDGSCVQIINNGIYMLLSYEAYGKLIEYYKGV